MLIRKNRISLFIAVYGLIWLPVCAHAQFVDTICFNASPPVFLNSSLPEGSYGIYTYEWQDSTIAGSWQPSAGANTDTSFQAGSLTEDTYFRRKAMSLVCGDESYSNTVLIKVYPEIDTSQVSITNTTCPDENDGAINLSVTGGAGNYSYQWSNNETSLNLSGIGGGTYSLTVTDQAGCVFSTSFTIESDNAFPEMTFDEDTIYLWSAPIIGSPGTYSQYSWSTGSTDSTTSVESSGSYTLTVFNEAGCAMSDTIYAVLILGQEQLESLSVKIFPNPTRKNLNVQLSNGEMPEVLMLYDLAGNRVIEAENLGELNVESIAAGVYTLSIQLHGSAFLKRIIIQ